MADERTPELDPAEGPEAAAHPESLQADPLGATTPVTPVSPARVLDDPEPAPLTGPEAVPAAPARAVPETTSESVRAEQARLRAEREARRAAREAALRPPPERPDPVAIARAAEDERHQVEPLPPIVQERVVTRRNTDSFLPSFALFILRIVVAVILGIRGVGVLLDLQGATELIGTTILPMPGVLAIVLGVAEALIALALVFGLMTRIAGLGVLIIAVSALAFVLWGPWSPFVAGQPGFTGELEVLLAAVGFLFVSVGGGAWGLDHGFRTRRAESRLDAND